MREGLLITEGILHLDASGIVTSLCRGFELIFGYAPADVIGRDCSFLFPPEQLDGWKKICESAASFPVKEQIVKMLRRDGSQVKIYLSLYPLGGPQSRPSSFMCILSTHRCSTSPGILSEEFNRIFKFSNDAVVITDRNGVIIDVNQAFCDTYGFSREEAFGQNPRILRSQHSKKEIYERMWRDILDPAKGFWRGEIINRAKDGREIPFLLSINAIKDEDGEIKNFLGIAYNTMRQKELDRIKKMYVDYVIHDIRGPLTTITINSELLLMQLDGAQDKAARKINMILESTRKIKDMTTDVLDFSRAQNGALPLNKEKVDAARIFRQAAAPFENSGKSLYVNGAAYGEAQALNCSAVADAGKLQRVMYNLMSNAFKYASSEVRVTVETGPEGFRFTISDDGKGITREEGERIFEAFYQTEHGVKTGGAGLGLSIVKSFVEAHGGRVWVDAGQPRGVTFGFSLP